MITNHATIKINNRLPIGYQIRDAIDAIGLSQVMLAELMQQSGHSWHPTTVRRILYGERDISAAEAETLSQILTTGLRSTTRSVNDALTSLAVECREVAS